MLISPDADENKLNDLEASHDNIRRHIDSVFREFDRQRRKKEKDLCAGNSKKAIKRFWTHINKMKSSTIENIKEVINPETNKLTSDKEEIMDITENHIIKQMNASFSQNYARHSENEDEGDHLSYCKRKRVESGDEENPKRLKSDDSSKSYINDPAGYLDQDFCDNDIDKILQEIDNGKACGPDGIPNEAFKNLNKQFKILLKELYNRVKNEGIVPENWKRGRLILIHKKNELTDISNYRPITIVNAISGIYTRLLNIRLIKVVEHHKILGEIQGGFRQDRCSADLNLF